jgi:flagellar basal-body rod modification protein FlgD
MIPVLASVASGVLSAAAQNASSPTTTSTSQTLGKDDFLRLLTAQLRNQDPLSPMDNTAFVAQTAQFSSLEQLQNMNQSLEKLLAQAGGGVAGAAPLLGRTVTVNGTSLALQPGQPATLAYQLPSSAAAVAVQIQNAAGTPVRTLALGAQGSGAHQLAFDGRDDAGHPLAAGAYSYTVQGVDAAGQAIPGVYTGGGSVSGISVENGQLILQVGAQRVPLTAVVGITAAGGM